MFKQEADSLEQRAAEDINEFFDNICNKIYKCAEVTIYQKQTQGHLKRTRYYTGMILLKRQYEIKSSILYMEANDPNRRRCAIQKTDSNSSKNNQRASKIILAAFLRRPK